MTTSAGTEGRGRTLEARLAILSPTQVGGHVFDAGDPDRRFVVELLIDGAPAALARADIHDPDLAVEGRDGCYGFVFSIDDRALRVARQIEIRLANGGAALAPPLLLQPPPPAASAPRGGMVCWLGGLRLNGWLPPGADSSSRVRAIIDGQVVAEAAAAHWTHFGEGREVTPAPGFDLQLPARFADGCVHHAQVLDAGGRELPGSPCVFVAFDDGLRRFIDDHAEISSQRLRGDLYDRLMPQSLPFSMFAEWRARFPAQAPPAQKAPPAEEAPPAQKAPPAEEAPPAQKAPPAEEASPAQKAPPAEEAPPGQEPPPAQGMAPKVGVALIGEGDVEASVLSLQAQAGCEWVGVALDGGGETMFSNAGLREFLDGEAKDCESVVFALSGAVFEPTALAQFAQALALFPAAPLAYADFTVMAEDGGEWPVALSAFDYERMLEQGAGALLFAARMPFAREAAAGGADSLFRLFNVSQDGRRARGPRHSEALAAAPAHLPSFLARLPRLDVAAAATVLARANDAHFARRGASARSQPDFGALLPAVHVRRAPSRVKVSVLVPTRDRVDLLKPCLESLVPQRRCRPA